MKKLITIILVLFCLVSFGQTKYLVKNGEIVQTGIPDIFKRPNGQLIYGGYKKLTQYHYVDGWRAESMPIYNPTLKYLGVKYYDAQKDSVTWTLIDRVLPTLAEAKTAKIAELKSAVKDLYNSIQWYISMQEINGDAIPTTVLNKIKAIRTKYIEQKANINALTTVKDVLEYQIPYDAINSIKQQLEDIQ